MRLALRYWFSRRALIATVVLMVVGGAAATLSSGLFWLGSWKVALDWGSVSAAIIGPLCAGTCAVLYARGKHLGLPDMAAASVRPVATWLGPAIVVWLIACAAVLLITLGTTSAAWATGAQPYPALVVILAHTWVVLGSAVAVGVTLGTLIPSLWSGPLAAAAVYLLGVLSALGTIEGIYDFGGVTGTMAGETYDAVPLTLQALSSVGFAALILALCAPSAARGRRAVVFTILVVAGGLVSYAALATSTDASRYTAADTVQFTCEGRTPQVCLAAETTRGLNELAGKFESQRDAAVAAVDLPIPERFEQSVAGAKAATDAGVITVPPEQLLRGEVDDEYVSLALATPRPCSFLFAQAPPARALNARTLLVRWIGVQTGTFEPSTRDRDYAWLTQPTRDQQAWLHRTYGALTSCDTAALSLPKSLARP